MSLSVGEFLKIVVRAVEDAGIPYMLTGSLASAFYATPRSTQDIDLVIDPTEQALLALVDRLSAAGCYVDRDAALEALRTRAQFNAIEPDGGWKVDLIVRKDRPFSIAEFDRRQRASFLGIEITLTRVEDVILAKLEWSRLGDSERQRRDVTHLLEQQSGALDIDYIDRWVTELGLEVEWAEARRRASRGE